MRAWSRAAPVMPVGPPITSPAARAIPPRRGRVPAAWRGARGRRTRRRAPRGARSPRAPAHGAAPPPATASARAAPRSTRCARRGRRRPRRAARVERQRLEPLEGLTRRVAEVEAERRRDERIAVGVAELRRAGVVNVVPDGEVRLAQLDVPLVAPPVRAAPPLAASGGGAA